MRRLISAALLSGFVTVFALPGASSNIYTGTDWPC